MVQCVVVSIVSIFNIPALRKSNLSFNGASHVRDFDARALLSKYRGRDDLPFKRHVRTTDMGGRAAASLVSLVQS